MIDNIPWYIVADQFSYKVTGRDKQMHADINMEFNILGEFSLKKLVSEYSS